VLAPDSKDKNFRILALQSVDFERQAKKSKSDAPMLEWGDLDAAAISFLDSEKPQVERRFRSQIELVEIDSLLPSLFREDFVSWQTTRKAEKTYFLRIEKDALPGRLRLRRWMSKGQTVAASRLVIELAPNAQLDLEEEVIGEEGSSALSLHHTELRVLSGARLRWVQTMVAQENADHFSRQHVSIQEAASVQISSLHRGGRRHQSRWAIEMQGAHAKMEMEAQLYGAHREKLDLWADVFHRTAGADSHIKMLSVANDVSWCHMNGCLRVDQSAPKSSAVMKMRGLYRSSRAQIEGMPQLEILNDDVQVAHGCALSGLSNDQLFYLRSRGITQSEAEQMMVNGLIQEMSHFRDAEQMSRLWTHLDRSEDL
jgi:Fe-S cluster assembly protein SufD